jgi:hypothetical protein
MTDESVMPVAGQSVLLPSRSGQGLLRAAPLVPGERLSLCLAARIHPSAPSDNHEDLAKSISRGDDTRIDEIPIPDIHIHIHIHPSCGQESFHPGTRRTVCQNGLNFMSRLQPLNVPHSSTPKQENQGDS